MQTAEPHPAVLLSDLTLFHRTASFSSNPLRLQHHTTDATTYPTPRISAVGYYYTMNSPTQLIHSKYCIVVGTHNYQLEYHAKQR